MELDELYTKFSTSGQSACKLYLDLSTLNRFKRAGYAYYSVLTGVNPVVGTSNHEYKKFKAFLLYLGGFIPIFFKNSVLKKAIEITRSNRKIVIVPVRDK